MTGTKPPRGEIVRRAPPRSFEQRTAKDAIASALTFRGISDAVRGERLITEWTDLVGPKIAARTRPDGIYERVLTIEVASSAWLHELNLLRAQILAGLIERLGAPRLFDDLKFRIVGRGRERAPVRPSPRPSPVVRPAPVPATGAAREQIVRDVERVDDAELRELIARVRIANGR